MRVIQHRIRSYCQLFIGNLQHNASESSLRACLKFYLVEGFDGYVMVRANRIHEHHILLTLATGNNGVGNTGDEARMQDQDDPQTMG